MLSVAEAQRIVLAHACPLPAEETPLSPAALGLVLAEDVASDIDMPPFNKAMMDGFAVRAADVADGRAVLAVVEDIVAGRTPQTAVGVGQCARIMTGAPLPEGTDAVVMVERTRMLDGDRVEISDPPLRVGQNVLPRGREMQRGHTALAAGAMLRPQELGLLATVGRTTARLIPAPQVAILSTGDEVVEAAEKPGPGQIRNSNGPMLTAQVRRAGAAPRYLGIAPDRLERLRSLVAEGLTSPVLVLSGGVSAGKRDLVPEVLQELGVQSHFHKVAMKPGKPVFFGTRAGCLVFGLPGNPVSALVCFELFVRPVLRRLRGHPEPGPCLVQAVLAQDFSYRTDRETYHPARLEYGADSWAIRPVPWFGSPDLRALTLANALVVLPVGDHKHAAGTRLPVLRVEDDI